ncbi:hypothetical protein ACIPY6_28480 [Streptomyces sp. NPDC090054]|uniref:hypothetical protein n=1 Tax=Streptomyces sp. NPDC090054 TaxID=3365933 RepID=UPI0038021080
MTVRTMSQSEADLRAALASLANLYDDLVTQAPRHPEYLYIDPLKPWQRAEHDRAVAYRNATHAIRHLLRTGQIPANCTDTADLGQRPSEESAS